MSSSGDADTAVGVTLGGESSTDDDDITLHDYFYHIYVVHTITIHYYYFTLLL